MHPIPPVKINIFPFATKFRMLLAVKSWVTIKNDLLTPPATFSVFSTHVSDLIIVQRQIVFHWRHHECVTTNPRESSKPVAVPRMHKVPMALKGVQIFESTAIPSRFDTLKLKEQVTFKHIIHSKVPDSSSS